MEFIPYFLVFSLVAAIGVGETSNKKTFDKHATVFLLLVPLVALATFRPVGVGSDDLAYVDIFFRIPSILDCQLTFCGYDYSEIQVEPGFFGLLSILRVFGKNTTLLFLTISTLAVLLNLKAISFFAQNSGAATLIYFSHFYLAKELNAIRTGLATAILFYAATQLYQKKTWQFAALVIVAASVHVSALLALLPAMVFILSPSRPLLIVISALLLFASKVGYFSEIMNLGLLIGPLQEKIDLYSNAEEYNYAIDIFDIVNIRNIVIVALSLTFWRSLSSFSKSFEISFYFFFCATMLRLLFGDFAIIAGRSYAAISMFEYIMIPLLFTFFAGNRIGYTLSAGYALLTLLLNISVNSGWTGGVKYLLDLI